MAGFGFWQLNLSTAQNDFSKFWPGWWQFCWMTGVKFNSIHYILVRFLHITQFTVCAAKNLTVFVADSPRCLEWSSMVAAVSRALREVSEPCLGWTREPRRQPKSLGARRQYSQATANNVLPVKTGSPAFLTRPPPVDRLSCGKLSNRNHKCGPQRDTILLTHRQVFPFNIIIMYMRTKYTRLLSIISQYSFPWCKNYGPRTVPISFWLQPGWFYVWHPDVSAFSHVGPDDIIT